MHVMDMHCTVVVYSLSVQYKHGLYF